MAGITYFKLRSQYEGDTLKNCALTGTEVDNNFYTLEGRDIDSVYVSDGKVVVNLKNGETMTTESLTENCLKSLDIKFDEVNGILTITKDGVTQTITGFATNYNIGDAVSVDGSLVGNGMSKTPIGLSPIIKTGQYRPVKDFIKVTDGERLPHPPFVFPGDRYLTQETVNSYGFLYNYEGVKKIACALKDFHSEWRVPTKEDWDDMLDAIEPEDFRNHTSASANKHLGHLAGKFLKSKDFWTKDNKHFDEHHHDHHHHGHHFGPHIPEHTTCIDYVEDCSCGRPHSCHPNYCGEYGHCHHKHAHDNNGIDSYGFGVVPAGVADDGKNYRFFKERTYFWTATNHEYRNAYAKAFSYDKSSVLQDICPSTDYFSVRLIKDFNGDNYNEREDILGGVYSTVLMPSLKHGKAVWTSVNISVLGCGCDGKHLIPNNNQGLRDGDVTKYFINEWTGKGWVRKEVLDGEVVVLAKEEKIAGGKTVIDYSELRLEGGDMVNVATKIYNEVVDGFAPDVNKIKDDISTLKNDLMKETVARVEEDNKLQGQIDELKQQNENNNIDVAKEFEEIKGRVTKNEEDIVELNDKVKKTNENLTTVNENLVTAIDNINKNVFDGFTNINEAIGIVNGRVDEEKDARIAADEVISKEFEEVKNEFTEIKTDFDNTKTLVEETVEKVNNQETEIQELKDGKVEWVDSDIIEKNKQIHRREIVLPNHSGLLGKTTEGEVYNLAMVSVWDIADLGSSKLHLNLNGKDRPTYNDSEELAYLSDIKNIEDSNKENNEAVAKELEDLKKSVEDEAVAREEAVAAETKAREEKDNELEAKLVDSVEFDKEKGQIIIKRFGENEEDIKVQLTMNFGKF